MPIEKATPKTKAAPSLAAIENHPSWQIRLSSTFESNIQPASTGNVNDDEKENAIVEKIPKKPRRQNEQLVVHVDGKTLRVKDPPPPPPPTPAKARNSALRSQEFGSQIFLDEFEEDLNEYYDTDSMVVDFAECPQIQ